MSIIEKDFLLLKRKRTNSMTQEQIVKEFVNGATEGISGGSGNLKIQGNKLVHYNTIIAERFGDKFIFNTTRYSLVTGRIQKMLKESVDNSLVIIVHGVSEGTRDTLQKYMNQ